MQRLSHLQVSIKYEHFDQHYNLVPTDKFFDTPISPIYVDYHSESQINVTRYQNYELCFTE